MKIFKNFHRKIVWGLIIFIIPLMSSASNVLIYQGEDNYSIEQDVLIIDNDDTGGDVQIQFGYTLMEKLYWDENGGDGSGIFTFTDDLLIEGNLTVSGSITANADLDLNLNQLIETRLENLGSAPICAAGSYGRMYFDTVLDGSYLCTSTGWVQETNSVGSSGTGNYAFTLDLKDGVRSSMGKGLVAGNNIRVLRADSSGNSQVRWTFVVPPNWETGTDIIVEILWNPSDSNSGNVRFEFDYDSWDVGDVVVTPTYSQITSTDAVPAVTSELVTTGNTFTIPSSSLGNGKIVNIKFNRNGGDASDTYGSDINIHQVIVKYVGN